MLARIRNGELACQRERRANEIESPSSSIDCAIVRANNKRFHLRSPSSSTYYAFTDKGEQFRSGIFSARGKHAIERFFLHILSVWFIYRGSQKYFNTCHRECLLVYHVFYMKLFEIPLTLYKTSIANRC